MTTADKIKYILQITYWTQQQLADKVGVKQTTVSAWLRGRAVREKYIDRIELLYNQSRRLQWDREQLKPKAKTVNKVLSKRGKIVLKFPWYSYQKGGRNEPEQN